MVDTKASISQISKMTTPSLTHAASVRPRRTQHFSNQNFPESNSRLEDLETNFAKIKILLSAILKHSRLNTPEIMKVVEEVYSPEELTKLDLKANSSFTELQREDSKDFGNLSLNKEITLIKETSNTQVKVKKQSS